ncbi:MAG: phosphopentomutase [Oscillospiraceae bacterium]|nr:phosphopentomutase [Oscillospiraceae bacterium]
MGKRLFLIVMDSVGIGEMPDAHLYGDAGSNTLAAVCASPRLDIPCLRGLGLFNIDGVTCGDSVPKPLAAYARMAMKSPGKDTTTGHWELAGVILDKAFPTFPGGFPEEVINALQQVTGRGILCNKPYSGTKVIADYGARHMETGALIVYTSADSVLQIAAHENIIPPGELYRICTQAREIMRGELGVGRIIARPFEGAHPFRRTANRHDFSLAPPDTMLDYLLGANLECIGVGKIPDIFAGKGISRAVASANNREGMLEVKHLLREDFTGLCFVNLVDFDMLYGHRNDTDGYAQALTDFDRELREIPGMMRPGDLLIITADHGCDPSTPSTDHSREYVPMLALGHGVKPGVNLGTRESFADVAAAAQEYFGLPIRTHGKSFLP